MASSSARAPSMSPKPLSTMFAPWRARALARPRPMPLVEPVTRAVLPCSIGFPPNELRCNYDAINDALAAHYSSASALLPDATPMIEPRLHRVLCPGPASPATPAKSGTDAPAPAGMHRMAYWEWRGWGAWNDPGHPAHSRVVVCVHGLARQGRDFDSLARALSPHARVICPDVAGRGQSDWLADPMAYQIPQYASDMLALLAQLQQSGPISTLDWVGTSMGGLIGLVIAGQPGLPLPVPVRRLVLNDVGPVIQWQALQRIAKYLGRWGQFDSLQQAADALWSVSSSFGPHTPAQWLELSRALGRPLPPGGVGGPCRKAGWHCTTTRRLPCHSGPRTPRQSLSLRARPPCGACTIRSRPARCCCAACSPTCSRQRRRRRWPGADPGRMSSSSKAWGMPPC